MKGAVGEVIARTIPRAPASLDKLRKTMWRCVRSCVVIGVDGAVLLPTLVTVRLATEDFEVVADLREWVAGDLAQRLVDEGEKKGWALAARPIVVLRQDPACAIGRPRASAEFIPATTADAAPQSTGPIPGLHMVGIGPAPSFRLDANTSSYVIGRSRTCDLRVLDTGVSRRHAELAYNGDGTWSVRNLASTNGVRINGQTVSMGNLCNGDELRLSSATGFTLTVIPEAASTQRDNAEPE